MTSPGGLFHIPAALRLRLDNHLRRRGVTTYVSCIDCCEGTRHLERSIAGTAAIGERMLRNRSVQDQLELRAMQLRDAAEMLPDGCERQSLLLRARRIEEASILIENWEQ